MGLSIRNRELEKLARFLAGRSGRSMTEEILQALRDRKLFFESGKSRRERVEDICDSCAALPDIESATPDRILGYDGEGLFEHGG